MIRIFITTLIYLIGLFTQAQEHVEVQGFKPESSFAMNVELKDISESKGTVYLAPPATQNNFDSRQSLVTNKKRGGENLVSTWFYEGKFELRDKDLTFEIR